MTGPRLTIHANGSETTGFILYTCLRDSIVARQRVTVQLRLHNKRTSTKDIMKKLSFCELWGIYKF